MRRVTGVPRLGPPRRRRGSEREILSPGPHEGGLSPGDGTGPSRRLVQYRGWRTLHRAGVGPGVHRDTGVTRPET